MFNSTIEIPFLLHATWETIYMVFISSVLSIIFGLVLGVLLFIAGKNQPLENTVLQRSLGLVINVTRSIPFIILMIAIIPFTRFVVGTSIGTNAAIVPLTIAAIPFFARVVESALAEVPYGLIEAAHALGASTWQVITKVLLPESLPALIRGATLTIIGLVGYSAMAGTVGGGGLGELAIQYGYLRFDLPMMFATVVILVVLVQILQMLGDHLAKNRRLKGLVIGSLILGAICVGTSVYSYLLTQEAVVRVGVMSGQPEIIMQAAKKVAEKDYGLKLKIITFNDYVQPNLALVNKDIDANIFQHLPYLDAQIASQHFPIVPLAKTFVYPMGFYSKRIKDIKQLKVGAIVAIPNDPSNGGRALLVLQSAGLIQLKPGVGTLATIQDITANKYHLQIKQLDAAQLPRVLDDADLVAITNDFVGPAHLEIQNAVIKEGKDSPYANLIVIRKTDIDDPILKKLVEVMHSKAVVDETAKMFPNGAAIPAW